MNNNMRVKALMNFKGKFCYTYIGRISKDGKFHFRNKQLRKACYKRFKETFHYECDGGSLTIPDIDRKSVKVIFNIDKYLICYNCVVPKKEDNKYIVTYWKN